MKRINLYKQTLTLLRNTDLSVPKIAKATKLKQRWLNLVKNDQIPDPGVHKIENLYNYLQKDKRGK